MPNSNCQVFQSWPRRPAPTKVQITQQTCPEQITVGPIALARKCASGPNVGKPRAPYGTHTQPVGFIHTCGTRPTLGKVSYPVWGFWCTAGGLSMGLPTIYCGARTYPIHYIQGVIMGTSTIYCGAQTYPLHLSLIHI